MAKILLVEDEATPRLLLKAMLLKWGHEVVTAEDLAEAKQALGAHKFDAVVTDLNYPGERTESGGLELIDFVRTSPQREMPLYLHSNDKGQYSAARAHKADIVNHKPDAAGMFKPVDFYDALHKLVPVLPKGREWAAKQPALAPA